ncbi:AzlD domain-containing protein [Palleronia rufa]|uniref:AzlD domain-containing protein n=1 Tax=Palleronia rufa TaxID=1530186 RepID=UPI0005639857|nr:AzlD domain-containing protein [Palleronia rufa]
MSVPDPVIWLVIVVLGLGTFALRFCFLGLLADRPLPAGARRLLRYTAVGVFPGLVAPAVLSPAATGGAFDPARAIAALVALALGIVTRQVLPAILGGGGALYLMLWLLG